MEDEQMKAFADALWAYFLPKIKDYLSDSVCYYQAEVTSAPANGSVGVTRPFDSEVTLPYAANAASLQVGEQCTVLVFGDFSNQLVIGNPANL